MSMRIAFATSDEFPHLTDDDRLSVKALERHGIQVNPALWTDQDIDWSGFSAVVIRSCWDYHLKPEDFKAWLEKLESAQVTLWNPYATVRWNMDKLYLNDLRESGFPVLDSVWLTKGSKTDLKTLMLENGWTQAVVKPKVSAAANNTFLVVASEAKQSPPRHLSDLISSQDVIVQEFAQEIQTDGEWSLVFFNKKYSHAVIKQPQDGDFRVQRDFGGRALPTKAPQPLVAQAQKVIDSIPGELLYARVDGIERNGILSLMELELIEPHLFFELDSSAPERFANALAFSLSGKERRK